MGYIFGEIDFSVVRCYNSFSGILSSELGLGKEEQTSLSLHLRVYEQISNNEICDEGV